MRCADLRPMPGMQRSASMSCSSLLPSAIRDQARVPRSEGKLETRGKAEAGGELCHLFLGSLLHAAHGIVHRRGHQVLQHPGIVPEEIRLDLDAANLVAAV